VFLLAKNKIFIERIKELRNIYSITQKDLAENIGVSISTIKSIESKRSGTAVEHLIKISELFNVPLKEIYWKDYRETKVFSVLNSKSMCAKTTVVQNLSYELSLLDKKILIVDADLKCNLSQVYRMDFDLETSLYTAIMETDVYGEVADINKFIHHTEYDGLDIISSHFEMATIDMDMSTKRYREDVIKKLFYPLIEKRIYDYIIFDCNTSMGLLNENIMQITNQVIIPVEMSAFGVSGIYKVFNFISKNMKSNKNLKIFGFLEIKVNNMNTMTKKDYKIVIELIEKLKHKILDIYISRDSNISQAQLERIPLRVYMKKNKKISRANIEFKRLAREVVGNA
jgi:chromosome partitioning protein